MTASRRQFLTTSAAYAAGFAGLRLASQPASALAKGVTASVGYGSLVPDPEGLLDLPRGFAYQVIGRAGEELADGLLLPGQPDGMAAFEGPDGLTLLMRNHELFPTAGGAFGEGAERLAKVDAAKLYDQGATLADGSASLPGAGGVTTVVYDTRRQRVESQFLSLAGTFTNCAGGPTPWGTWLTCEEAIDSPSFTTKQGYACRKEHGYPFEVTPGREPGLQQATPLKAMGRFRREAVAVDPEAGVVYQTEDMDDGAFYRFLPAEPGNLAAGGKLQALAIDGRPSLDTRNWKSQLVAAGDKLPVRWIDLDDAQAPKDDLRYRTFNAGGARFARGEGIWWVDGAACFACTTGGKAEIGQLWRYHPTGADPTSADGGTLELFIEPNDSQLIHNADNLTVAPAGDLVVCEDRQGPTVRLIGVTPAGQTYVLAHSHARTEFAGVCFSPDGTTMFVNIQGKGLTVAITGPWRQQA